MPKHMKVKTLNYPPIHRSSPVMALAADDGALWAGGFGGTAVYRVNAGWKTVRALSPVAALAVAGESLLAGGGQGIALSRDRGQNWLRAEFRGKTPAITVLAPSPAFAQDNTVLAGTVGSGILRSDDGGARWQDANFGVPSFEVTTLAWLNASVALAGTSGGVCRSPNAGRAWKVCPGTEGGPIAALTVLEDGAILAGVELGGVLRSLDHGLTWMRHGDLPPDIQILSMFSAAHRVLMGTANYGLLVSADGGLVWHQAANELVWCFAKDAQSIYAGTDAGVIFSDDDGITWNAFPTPPLHDLRRLLAAENRLLVYGTQTAPALYDAAQGWVELANVPLPLLALAAAPDGGWVASSGAGGLVHSSDGGLTWFDALRSPAGRVHHLTMQQDGLGYAASEDGTRFLRTRDYGLSWEELHSPFGVLSVTALQALQRPRGRPGAVVAATYNPDRQTVRLWHSADEGANWEQGMEIRTSWPLVCTLASPVLVTVGGFVFLEQPGGGWQQIKVGDGSGIRAVTGSSALVIVLTDGGLYRSHDGGSHWSLVDLGIPAGEMDDLALDGGTLYILLTGGRVLSCAVADFAV